MRSEVGVESGVAVDVIVTGLTVNRVFARTAGDMVVALAAVNRIVPGAGEYNDTRWTCAGINDVVTRAAEEISAIGPPGIVDDVGGAGRRCFAPSSCERQRCSAAADGRNRLAFDHLTVVEDSEGGSGSRIGGPATLERESTGVDVDLRNAATADDVAGAV